MIQTENKQIYKQTNRQTNKQKKHFNIPFDPQLLQSWDPQDPNYVAEGHLPSAGARMGGT